MILLAIAANARQIDNLAELKKRSTNPIFSKLGAAPRNGGFSMKGYWVWCGSAVKGDDNKYHLFASRWPDSLVFHPGWMVASEIVHAMANKPEGPYTFSEMALPARGAQYWDGRATHNPFLWKDASEYNVIFNDQVARFTGEKGGGVLAHSKDGVKWTIDKDPKAYSRTLEWNDGKTEMQGQLERPFILFGNKRPAWLFFATMDGPGGFNNATRSWNMVIPFKP